jgi:hypothetical protein
VNLQLTMELGLAAGALASLIRKLASEEQRARAPIGCNACLSTWSALALWVLVLFSRGFTPWFPVVDALVGLGSFMVLPRLAFLFAVKVLASAGIAGFILSHVNPAAVDFGGVEFHALDPKTGAPDGD